MSGTGRCGSFGIEAHTLAVDNAAGLFSPSLGSGSADRIRSYLNGHEWLTRKLAARGIRCTKLENVFACIEDLPPAQRLANRSSQLDWPRILNRCASRVVPQLDDVFYGCQDHWVTAQAKCSASRRRVGGSRIKHRVDRGMAFVQPDYAGERVVTLLTRHAQSWRVCPAVRAHLAWRERALTLSSPPSRA